MSMLTYKVKAKYAKGPENLIAQFEGIAEAHKFILEKLEMDAALKVNVLYNLYDTGELMETFDQSKLQTSQGSNSEEGISAGGGQQQSGTQRFSPSPLQTTMRPTGMPVSSFKDDKKPEDK
jgi:hypothetical protein